jgi:protein-S-isoprenylcysteine O-methyltransferase Ste14
MQAQLILKASLSAILLPGAVIVLGPYLILSRSESAVWPGLSVESAVAVILGLLGIGVLLHCIWSFAVQGKGALAPVDPPKVLVVCGVYRYTRNPMYVAVLTVLVAEALFFGSRTLAIYAGAAFFCFHLFVVLYEEPHLRRQFGTSYKEYCRAVPRWGVSLRRYTLSGRSD